MYYQPYPGTQYVAMRDPDNWNNWIPLFSFEAIPVVTVEKGKSGKATLRSVNKGKAIVTALGEIGVLPAQERGESKVALDDYYRLNALPGETHYDFCVRNGWKDYVDTMIAVDYIIQNRDRHGANIEVLRNARAHTTRIAPLFDHGLSLLYSCATDEEAKKFDAMADRKCQNFIGTFSCKDNLKLLGGRKDIFPGKLQKKDKATLLAGLDGVLSETFLEAIWRMIHKRYTSLESEINENV